MTPEGDHHERISCHRLVPLSRARCTKYYVHEDALLYVSMKLLTSPISRHNRYSHNYQSNVYHIE